MVHKCVQILVTDDTGFFSLILKRKRMGVNFK